VNRILKTEGTISGSRGGSAPVESKNSYNTGGKNREKEVHRQFNGGKKRESTENGGCSAGLQKSCHKLNVKET